MGEIPRLARDLYSFEVSTASSLRPCLRLPPLPLIFLRASFRRTSWPRRGPLR